MMDNCGRRTGAEGTAETHFFWAKTILVDGQHGEGARWGPSCPRPGAACKGVFQGYDLRMFLRAPATVPPWARFEKLWAGKSVHAQRLLMLVVVGCILCECEIAWQKRCEVIASEPHGAISVRIFPTTDMP